LEEEALDARSNSKTNRKLSRLEIRCQLQNQIKQDMDLLTRKWVVLEVPAKKVGD
jgi:hypothetical protein